GFFATPWTAMATLVFINSWRWFPFIALMMLAGLTRIPDDLYEAARIDGANAWQRFKRITWPLLAPTLGVLAVIGTLLSFNVFDIIWLMTSGGPAGGSRTLPVLIYETAFKGYRLSEAATVSVLATLLLMAFAVVATRALDQGDDRCPARPASLPRRRDSSPSPCGGGAGGPRGGRRGRASSRRNPSRARGAGARKPSRCRTTGGCSRRRTLRCICSAAWSWQPPRQCR